MPNLALTEIPCLPPPPPFKTTYPSPCHPPKKDVVDLLPDVGPEAKELAVYPVQDGLQHIPLTRVLRVKQFQDIQNKRLINEPLGQGGLELLGLQKPQQYHVDQLK